MSDATYQPGDRVRVKALYPPGHIRTPRYVRGKTGWVEAVHGDFRNPESLAYGGDGLPKRTLYLVGFRQRDVWGSRYQGAGEDKVFVDVYEHWLEPA
jgi:nitrile hydratase